jgi:hypothetical protein
MDHEPKNNTQQAYGYDIEAVLDSKTNLYPWRPPRQSVHRRHRYQQLYYNGVWW